MKVVTEWVTFNKHCLSIFPDVQMNIDMLSFLILFCLADELPQDAYLLVLVLVEVEPIPLTLLYLRKVVVQCLLRNIHHPCPILQRHLLPHSDASVQLAPSEHLLNHVLDLPLLQTTTFQVVIPLLLRDRVGL